VAAALLLLWLQALQSVLMLVPLQHRLAYPLLVQTHGPLALLAAARLLTP
jgi:hypothetical protein